MLSNRRFFIRAFLIILVLFVTWIALTASAKVSVRHDKLETKAKLAQGLIAWDQVYSVLISPRCIN